MAMASRFVAAPLHRSCSAVVFFRSGNRSPSAIDLRTASIPDSKGPSTISTEQAGRWDHEPGIQGNHRRLAITSDGGRPVDLSVFSQQRRTKAWTLVGPTTCQRMTAHRSTAQTRASGSGLPLQRVEPTNAIEPKEDSTRMATKHRDRSKRRLAAP